MRASTVDVQSVRDIGADVWSGLVEWGGSGHRRSLYLSYRWLLWAETGSALRPGYLVVRDEVGGVLGAVATYLWSGTADELTTWYDPVRVFLTPHCAEPPDRERWFPTLLIGSRSGYHGDFLVHPSLSLDQRRAVVGELLRACRERATAHGVRCTALMYVPEPTAEEVRRATGSAARAVPTSAEALIQLRPEEDFEGYLKRFTSAKRNKFKREIRAFEAAGGKLAVRRLSEVAESVGPLLGDLHQRHGDDGSTAETMTRYLASQAAVLDEWSRVFVEERDGRITAFALAYAYDGCLYGRAAGFDRAAGVSPFAYFNLAFYAPLRYAADHGLSAVDLGTGAYQGKVLRGAELRPLWSAVWPPNDSEPAWLEALDHPAAEAVEAGVAKGHAHRSCTMTPSA